MQQTPLFPHTGTLHALFATEVVAGKLGQVPGRARVPLAPTAMAEFLREAVGVEGRELSEELALNSSELRLSEASLRPLLMELLSSQL